MGEEENRKYREQRAEQKLAERKGESPHLQGEH
jgi:hypothetical protein